VFNVAVVIIGSSQLVDGKQHRYPRCDCDPAIDSPANLAGHETARQHVDSLEEPDAPNDH
jgi:hypothetical protein